MSGGAYDYTYMKVSEFAEALENGHDLEGLPRPKSLLRAAFVAHLRKVAEAMKAIEWEDSGDGADENAAMMAVLLDPLPADEVIVEMFKARVARIKEYADRGLAVDKEDLYGLMQDYRACVDRGWPRTEGWKHGIHALDSLALIESVQGVKTR